MFNIGQSKPAASQAFTGAQGAPGRDLVGIDEAALSEQAHVAQKPFLVVGAGQIDSRRKKFDEIAARIDAPRTQEAYRTAHRQHAPLPSMMKNRLLPLRVPPPKPPHAPPTL